MIGTRFSFRYRPLVIQPAEGHWEILAEDVAEIGHTLFHEVAQIAVSLEKSLVGKDSMTQRALGIFRRIQEKLAVLAFVDARIGPILALVEDFLSRVPRRGPISGALFQEGFGLWLLLCDEARLARHGAGRLAGDVEPEGETSDVDPGEDLGTVEPAAIPLQVTSDDPAALTEEAPSVHWTSIDTPDRESQAVDDHETEAEPLDCFF